MKVPGTQAPSTPTVSKSPAAATAAAAAAAAATAPPVPDAPSIHWMPVAVVRCRHELRGGPWNLALTAVERFVRMAGKNERETQLFAHRVADLRSELAALPVDARADRTREELIWGKNHPNRHADFSIPKCNYAMAFLGSMTALTTPVTAALMPVAVALGWKAGQQLQPLPHFIADEMPDVFVPVSSMQGDTVTAYPTTIEYRAIYENQVADVIGGKVTGIGAYALHGPPHHTFLGKGDPLFANPQIEASFMTALSTRLKWLTVPAALNPVGGLLMAFAGAASAAIAETSTTHMMSHQPAADISLVGLAMQAAGWVVTPAEHAKHHRLPHDGNYSGATSSVDERFDRAGIGSFANLLMFYRTQHGERRVIPTSWRRDPSTAEKILGPTVDLSAAHNIAHAHQLLVKMHKEMAQKAKNEDPHAFLKLPTIFDAYATLRKQVDGCAIEPDDLANALARGPTETKFVEELIPRAPHDAWPQLTLDQFVASVSRLREMHSAMHHNPNQP